MTEISLSNLSRSVYPPSEGVLRTDIAKPLVGPPFASHKEGKHVFLNLMALPRKG